MDHTDNEIKALAYEELLRYYREYKRRWRANNKKKIQLYNLEYYKKYKRTSYNDGNNQENLLNNSDDIKRTSKENKDIKKINPLDIVMDRV